MSNLGGGRDGEGLEPVLTLTSAYHASLHAFGLSVRTAASIEVRMGLPLVHADFQNVDEHGRLRLGGPSAREELARQGAVLAEGLPLLLYGDDTQPDGTSGELVVEGVVEADAATGAWVARVDWNAIRHESAR